jgi:copper homeostasis protein
MLAGIAAVKAASNPHGLALGVVFGATAGRSLDLAVLSRLVAAAAPLPVTVHKAFDEVDDQFAALDALIELGVDAVLTSGGAPTALEGAARLASLRRRAGDRLQVMAGGGIREHNVARVLAETGVSAVHLRAPMTHDGRELPESTDEDLVRRVLAAIHTP